MPSAAVGSTLIPDFEMRSARLLLFVLVACLSAFWLRAQDGSARPEATFSLARDRVALVSLDGRWRFHAGDDANWAAAEYDDSGWPLLQSDRPWSAQGYKEQGGFAWYRFTVQSSSAGELAVLLPSILTDYEIFANGKKIGGFGRMPPHGSLQFGQVSMYRLPPAPPNGVVHVAIRVWHHPIFASYLGGGTRYGGSLAGDASLVQEQLRLREADRSTYAVDIFTLGVFDGLVGLTVLGLFFSRNSEREYLWFAVVLLSGALTSVVLISNFLLHYSMNWRDFSTEALQSVNLIASLYFFSSVLNARHGRVWRAILILAGAAPLCLGLQARGWVSVSAVTCVRVLLDLPIEVWILALLVQRARAGSRDARLLLLPTMVLYGNQVVSGLLLCSYQLGWQQRVVSTSQWTPLQTPYRIETYTLVQLVFAAALLAFLIRRFAQSRASEQRHQADLEAARVLQQVLIPEDLPDLPGVRIESAYYPAQEVGGDFFQIFPMATSDPARGLEICIVIGDVAGKGLPAAMSVSFLVGALRSLSEFALSPAEFLMYLNRQAVSQRSGFVTCLALRLSDTGKLTVANAGHLAPYLNGVELPLEPALPLGVDEGCSFSESSFQLAEGDRLTLLTDGVPEATRERELFGFERTAEISTAAAQAVAERVRLFGQADDITVVTVDVLAGPAAG